MTTIAEIFQRARERLERNKGMAGNNCLVYFDNLEVRGDTYDGNASVAQVGNARGPWRAVIYLRLTKKVDAPNLDKALNGLEQIVVEWAKE